MDNVDRIINIIRKLKEQIAVSGGMTTGSSGSVAGFSGSADPKGPTAGYDKPLDGRSKVMRRLPPPYKSALINLKKKKGT